MTTIYILLILLIVTRIFGEISERLGQPALLGELVSGIFLGVLVHHYDQTFYFLNGLSDNQVFKSITDLGIFFLMLLGGIELNPVKLIKSSKNAFIVATGGVVVPFALGILMGYLVLPESDILEAQLLFLGTVMAVTAIPVSIKSLMDLGQLDTRVGQIIVSAALIDDVLSLVLLAILTGILESGSIPGLLTLLLMLGKMVMFFIVASALGHYILPAIGKRLGRIRIDEFEFSLLLIVAMGFAFLADNLG